MGSGDFYCGFPVRLRPAYQHVCFAGIAFCLFGELEGNRVGSSSADTDMMTASLRPRLGRLRFDGHQTFGLGQGGQFYRILTDALGSVRDIVDLDGRVFV